MNLAVLATVFGIIFVAELPDKTALASLVLGTKYRPGNVFVGVAAAFAVHVVLAIVAGSLLGLLPHRAVDGVVGVLFALGAVVMLRRRTEDPRTHQTGAEGPADLSSAMPAGDDHHPHLSGATLVCAPTAARTGFWRVAATSFLVLFVAEFGDLTQIAIANLAARYHDPLTVGVGAVLGLWAVGALAITGGQQLLRLIPLTWIVRIAAAVMTTLAVVSLLNAITG
ncbi:MAG: TMEM165/GDT1 family protein [Pseudonocardiaceae bacterium]|jgi:putative Ca2+/H+ antiporter (TMEM165/GDT1 family)|nr:TMEM165/GDT1 family protein [Pseudonocardiaceae bacterium]